MTDYTYTQAGTHIATNTQAHGPTREAATHHGALVEVLGYGDGPVEREGEPRCLVQQTVHDPAPVRWWPGKARCGGVSTMVDEV
jgi:hypothetical protein